LLAYKLPLITSPTVKVCDITENYFSVTWTEHIGWYVINVLQAVKSTQGCNSSH